MDNLYQDIFIYLLSFFNQRELIHLMRVSKNFYHTIDNLTLPNVDFYVACSKGYYLNIRKNLQYIKFYDLNKALLHACKSGHISIINLLLKYGADNYDLGLYAACKYGHKDIIDFMISKGATNFNFALRGTAEGGKKDIIDYIVENGATDFDRALEGACKYGHKEIIEYMIEKGSDNFNWGLYVVCKTLHVKNKKEIIDLLISKR